ncbi:Per os infectivity factor 3 [Perigonia lusca single nucleopolyhedrovirus]|uniref:Per os infectivity factor 3 n=1 Tax=Perigonia lusca single nucleopolyhedrovirus TaxID=1675865 RepID=A0A0M3WR51_9ABAC|nr:Per os infectivity factor 3 [Perigonia lusca single nucleopolyhedrovirus]AKN80670.1 Per os infectivity factor 3 [Perigonia lusca single nucleopolyhedrovirus]
MSTSVTFSTTFWGYLTIFVVLLIVYYYCMNALRSIRMHEETEDDSDANILKFIFDRNGVVDCNQTKLPCVTDRQCRDNCLLSFGETICDNGFCSLRSPNISGGEDDDTRCDSSLGLMKVFLASEYVVRQMCVSLYRDIVDDNGEIRPYICDNGRLNVDFVNRQFTAEDCTCAENYTKMLFVQTALVRSVPVCIPNSRLPLYSKIYKTI